MKGLITLSISVLLAACSQHQPTNTVAAAIQATPPTLEPSWSIEKVHTDMDGTKTVATKDFPFDAGDVLRVSLACFKGTKNVRVSVESYDNLDKDGNYQGAPLVTQDGEDQSAAAEEFLTHMGIAGTGLTSQYVTKIATDLSAPTVDGRVKFGDNAPEPIADHFSLDKYTNVITWDINREAIGMTAERLIKTSKTDISATGAVSQDVIDARQASLVFAAAVHQTSTIPKSRLVSIVQRDIWSPESYSAVFGVKSVEDTGTYLSDHLPMVIEVATAHGVKDVTIPKTTLISSAISDCSSTI